MRKKLRELKDKVPLVQPTEAKVSFKILGNDQIEQIHEATMGLLEEVGVKFPSQKALGVFEDAGAKVDQDTQVVKISRDIVEEALDNAPRHYTLAARKEDLDLELDGKHTYYDTSGTAGKWTVDLETRKKRAPRKSDVADMALIADYLPIISFPWPMVSAQDVPKETAPLHELEACFQNTQKHVQTETAVDEKLAKKAVEMGSIIAGDEDKLRKRPLFSCLICTVQPLAQDKGGVEAGLVYAEAGVPVGYMSMVTMGLSAPASPAAALAIGNAEIVSALTMIQLAHPGAPVFYSMNPAIIEPRTADYIYGSPLGQLTNAAGIELGHYYGVPTFGGSSFAGGGYEINKWQVGKENVYLALFTALSGSDIACGLGLMDAVNLLYPERIIFDNEIFQAVTQISSGIEVSEKTLLTDLIKDVGPRGNFIATKHTRDHLPELWPPGILYEPSGDPEDRYLDPEEIAIEEVKWILENHQPKPLEDKVEKEINKLLEEAEKEFTS